MSMDAESVVNWGRMMAMAFAAVFAVMLLFFACQKYFGHRHKRIEGINGLSERVWGVCFRLFFCALYGLHAVDRRGKSMYNRRL